VEVDGLLVQGVDHRRLGLPAGGGDVLGDRLSGSRVRPARKTLAPSRAKVRATAPPLEPPAP
jgi:hypothetical protein